MALSDAAPSGASTSCSTDRKVRLPSSASLLRGSSVPAHGRTCVRPTPATSSNIATGTTRHSAADESAVPADGERHPVLEVSAPDIRMAGRPRSCSVSIRRCRSTGAKCLGGRCQARQPGPRACSCRLRWAQPGIPGGRQGRQPVAFCSQGVSGARADASLDLAAAARGSETGSRTVLPRRRRRTEIWTDARSAVASDRVPGPDTCAKRLQ